MEGSTGQVKIKCKSSTEFGKRIVVATIPGDTERKQMLESNTKPGEKTYQVIVGQTRGEGQVERWDSKQVVATSFSVDENRVLFFWSADELVAAIQPEDWKRVEKMDDPNCKCSK